MITYIMIERFDFIFSYWIFAWYLLYELRLVSYNPKGALLLALLENLILLGVLVYYAYPSILTFCTINFFIKVVPLWRVRHTTVHRIDMYALLALLSMYCLWLWINEVTVMKVTKQQLENVKQKKPVGPVMRLYAYIRVNDRYYF
jgi:hypothetical protein